MFLSGDSLYEAYIIIYIIGLAPFYIHQMNRVNSRTAMALP